MSVDHLIKSAGSLIQQFEEGQVEAALVGLEEYLAEFEGWAATVGTEPAQGEEAVRLQSKLASLKALNDRLLVLSDAAKDSVSVKLGLSHKKLQALKSYIDRYPQRITITGKREG